MVFNNILKIIGYSLCILKYIGVYFMNLNKHLMALSLIFLATSISLQANDIVTQEMKNGTENVIKSCEQSYQNTKALRNKFDEVKKPGPFSSSKTKTAYKNLAINKKAFDIQFAEFTKFTNEKIKLRTAKTVSKLRDDVAAYSSNCSRFSSGIAGFVKWATTGQGPAGFEKIYQGWQDEAIKG